MSVASTPFDSRIQPLSRLGLHQRGRSIGMAAVALACTAFRSTRTLTHAKPPRPSVSVSSACTVLTGLTWSVAAWMTWCGRPASSPWPPLLGCRGSAPTEAPHTRRRGLGPGTGRTANTGSASGPAITLDNRCWRRAINVATSITSAESIVLEGFSAGADRSCAIIRRHSCAWQAVSDSQARSCGSSSRPSGVIRRSPRKEKPAQGPVKSIRWCGSNSIMPRSHPWPGIEGAGKSRARGSAIATLIRRIVPRPIQHFA